MTFEPTIGDGAQALDIATLLRHVQGNAVLSGLDVSLNSGAFDQGDTITVASGDVLVDGTEHSVSETDAQIDSATDNPRKDLVYVDGNGDVQVAQGQEAEALPVDDDTGQRAIREHAFSPATPDLSGVVGVPIYEVWVDPEKSSLEAADIFADRRPPGTIPTALLDAIGVSDLDFDPATQGELDSHAGQTNIHHSEDHGSRHHDGNADELVVESLGADSTDDSLFYGPDGDGGIGAKSAGGSSSIGADSDDGTHTTELLAIVEDTDDTTAFDETIDTTGEEYERIVVEFSLNMHSAPTGGIIGLRVNGVSSGYDTVTIGDDVDSRTSGEYFELSYNMGASDMMGTATLRGGAGPASTSDAGIAFSADVASSSDYQYSMAIRGGNPTTVSSVDSVRLLSDTSYEATGKVIVWGRRYTLI